MRRFLLQCPRGNQGGRLRLRRNTRKTGPCFEIALCSSPSCKTTSGDERIDRHSYLNSFHWLRANALLTCCAIAVDSFIRTIDRTILCTNAHATSFCGKLYEYAALCFAQMDAAKRLPIQMIAAISIISLRPTPSHLLLEKSQLARHSTCSILR